jgi:hypothetical protein
MNGSLKEGKVYGAFIAGLLVYCGTNGNLGSQL